MFEDMIDRTSLSSERKYSAEKVILDDIEVAKSLALKMNKSKTRAEREQNKSRTATSLQTHLLSLRAVQFRIQLSVPQAAETRADAFRATEFRRVFHSPLWVLQHALESC